MFIQERLQAAIHQLEVGLGPRIVRWLLILTALAGMTLLYDTRAYHGFDSPEAMDAAQVARNISEGQGFTTEFIRPFSLYLIQKHNRVAQAAELYSTNFVDAARIYTAHPDLGNAPLYPLVLAGVMKTWTPQWQVETRKPFWSDGGSFRRYRPEFYIAILNQCLLLAVVALTFLVTRKLFDGQAAWLAAGLTLGSDELWKFSVSGQSTMLVMVVFLALAWCLVKVDEIARAVPPDPRRLFLLALLAGLLTGLGMLTRYSFGWLIVPVVIFLTVFGGTRRSGLAVAAVLAFALVVSPWIVRNLSVSSTLFGTAGYAAAEGTFAFPDSRLMQSLNPDMATVFWMTPYEHKLLDNLGYILQGEVFRLGGGWMGILFFAGLLLGLRNIAARHLRYFVMMCLGVLIPVQAVGRTHLSDITPGFNSENLLVLLTPFVVIFGVAFFLTLLNQMNVPSLQARIGVILLLAVLIWQPLVSTMVKKAQTLSYPPYYPPDLQKISRWMRPEELVMSDLPWAVAWYGDRQCAWTTINSQYAFFSLNDQIKPVAGLFLSLQTVDAKYYSEGLLGGPDNWKHFAWQIVSSPQQSPIENWGKVALKTSRFTEYPIDFPLKFAPVDSLISGIFITDHQRW